MEDQRTDRESGGLKPSRWRWPQFSLWELLMAMTLLSITARQSILFPKTRGGAVVGCILLLCCWLVVRADRQAKE
jgi:hypothetical protein